MKTQSRPSGSSILQTSIVAALIFVFLPSEALACGGSAPFQVFSGNAVRKVEDMTVIPGRNAAPKWGRFHNTMPRRRDFWFGTGGCWRHYWQYDLIITEHGAEFIYPAGVRRFFFHNENGSWEAKEHFKETLLMEDDECMVTAADSSILRFIKAKDTGVMLTYRLVSVTDSLGATTTLDYDARGRLVGVRNTKGGALAIDYSEIEGRTAIAKVTSSDGRTALYSYEEMPGGRHLVLSGVRYSDNTRASYTYKYIYPGKPPMLETADDPRCAEAVKRIKYAYQKSPRVGEVYQEINPETGTAYATLEFHRRYRNLRTVRYAGGRTLTYETPLETNGRTTRMIDSLGRVTRMEYADNGRGLLEAVTDASGSRMVIERDRHGNAKRLVREAKAGGTPVRAIDAPGIQSPNYLSHTHELTRRAEGNIFSIIKGMNLRKEKNALKKAPKQPPCFVPAPGARRSFNERGQVVRAVNPDGGVLEYVYDDYGRLLSEKDAQGNRMEYTHDDFGRIITQKDPSGGVTTFAYSGIPDGCKICAIGLNPTRIRHSDGRVNEMTYDTEGRLRSKKLDMGTAKAAVTTYDYDELDNIIKVTLPDGTVVMEPDDTVLSSM